MKKYKWISVNEELPKHHQFVLVCVENKAKTMVVFLDAKACKEDMLKKGIIPPIKNDDKDFYFCSLENMGNYLNNVTHWMIIGDP